MFLVLGLSLGFLFANFNNELYEEILHFPLFSIIFWGQTAQIGVTPELLSELAITFLFSIAMIEVRKALLPGGNLYPISKAWNPILGTLGGVLIPILVFLGGAWYLVTYQGMPTETFRGFASASATDIALAAIGARIIFGKEHPVSSYLLTAAILDDLIGLVIILIFYQEAAFNPIGLLYIGGAILGSLLLKRLNYQDWWLYLLPFGILSWYGFQIANLEADLCLLPIVLCMTPPKVGDDVGERNPSAIPTSMTKYEDTFTEPTEVLLFMFGFAQGGIVLSDSSVGWVTLLVLSSLLIGKFIGVFVFAKVGDLLLGAKLPEGIATKELLAICCFMGVGTTVATFIISSAWQGQYEYLANQGKLGAILTTGIPMSILVWRGLRSLFQNPQVEESAD